MSNKSAVVTGGAGGIGLAICEELLKFNVQVTVYEMNFFYFLITSTNLFTEISYSRYSIR